MVFSFASCSFANFEAFGYSVTFRAFKKQFVHPERAVGGSSFARYWVPSSF